MTPTVRLTSAAANDLALARQWYLDEAPQVLASFEEAVNATLDRVAAFPDLYQTVVPTVRRAVVPKFPFSVFYRVQLPRIEVIAVLHQARDPRTWHRRTLSRVPDP